MESCDLLFCPRTALGKIHKKGSRREITGQHGEIPLMNARSNPRRGKGPLVCRFAANRILPLLDAALREAEGVRKGDDIEYLHRMRVASRRMRACLRTFRPFLGEKRFKKVFRRTREITRALSRARDADVQIAYLKKLRKREARRLGIAQGDGSGEEVPPIFEAIRFLLQKLRREREKLQADVVSALDRFEEEVPPVIRDAFRGISPLPAYPKKRARTPSTVHALAAEHVGRALRELLSYAPLVHVPEAVADHHAMRIAAKHLRYTMEIFSPLYRLGLQKYISRIAHIQGILGDLHDTDVWIDTVTLLLLKERSRPLTPGDASRPGPRVIQGLKEFQKDRERDRQAIYRKMVRTWDSLCAAGFWEDLKSEILTGYRAAYEPGGDVPDEEKEAAVLSFATRSTGEIDHSRHVATLALSLFDQLGALHGLSGDERALLWHSSLLHDVGLGRGRKGHAKAGATLIHGAEDLPLTVRERAVAGLVALVHRGEGREEDSGYLAIVSPDERRAALVLAGIVRVADGLDCTGAGKVREVRCEVAPGAVIVRAVGCPDCEREVATAEKRAGLLARVLGVALRVVGDEEGTAPCSPAVTLSPSPGT